MLAIALGGTAVGVGVAVGAYKILSTEVVTCDGCGTEIVDPDSRTVCTVCDTPLFEEGEDYMQYGNEGNATRETTDTKAKAETKTKTKTETEKIEL